MLDELAWGLKGILPENAEIAWGARTIFSNGVIDLLGDRQDFKSIHPNKHSRNAAFIRLLNETIITLARDRARELHRDGEIYDDDRHCLCQRIVGSPRWRCMARASGGYLYITVFQWSE